MLSEKSERAKLIFVYNADSGVFNLLGDIAHKMFSPETYSCNLCALTHTNFGMKKEWKSFLESIAAEKEFLHADEFKDKYNVRKTALPAVFRKDGNSDLEIMIDAPTINACKSINELILHLNSNLIRL